MTDPLVRLSADAPVEWLVVFQSMEPENMFPAGDQYGDQYGDRWGRAVRWLLRRVLRRGFQHVFAMRRADHFDGWVLVNLRGPGLDVIEIPGNAYLHDVVLRCAALPMRRWCGPRSGITASFSVILSIASNLSGICSE